MPPGRHPERAIFHPKVDSMILTTLVLTTLASAAPAGPAAAAMPIATSSPIMLAKHGKLDWYRGSWEELQAKAKSAKQLMFLDFTADW